MTLEPLKELERLQKENEELKKRLEKYELKAKKVCGMCYGLFVPNKGVLNCDSCLESHQGYPPIWSNGLEESK